MIQRLALLALLVSLAAGAPARAADSDAQGYPDREFAIGAYRWGTELEGTLEADRGSVDVDASFRDLLEELNVGVMLAAGGRIGRFVGLFDGIWMHLEDDTKTRTVELGSIQLGPAQIDADLWQGIADLKLGYRILEPDPRARQPVAIDLLAGGRYWYMKAEIDAAIPPIASRSLEESGSWVDPIVGLRVIIGLSPKLDLIVIGDVGGWGAGEAADHTWQAVAMLGVRLSDSRALRLGYKALDLERGSADINLRGPVLGALYRF
jgi:hypothetical protein